MQQHLTTLLGLLVLCAHCASAATTLSFCSEQDLQGECQNIDVPDEACVAVPDAIGVGVRSIAFIGPVADCFICENTGCNGICSASFNTNQTRPIFPDDLQNNVRSVFCS